MRRRWGIGLTVAAALLGGCQTAAVQGTPPQAGMAQRPSESEADRLTRQGLDALREGRNAEAVTAFNHALALTPSRAGLHLLTGLAYHLDYLNGNFMARDLAETGYLVAAQMDPSLTLAQLQLGRLNLDAKRPARAQQAFLKVLDAEPDNAEAAHGLAVASYYARDLQSAVGSVRRLAVLRPVSAGDARTAAMVYAAAGMTGEADAARTRLAALSGSVSPTVDRRLGQWRALHARLAPQLAQADDEDDDYAASTRAARRGGNDASQGDGGGARPMFPNWADCPQWSSGSARESAYVGQDDDDDSDSAGANIRPLRPLPSPCVGSAMPRMAVIDATIIRTEEVLYSSHGVNLLDGLKVMFNASKTVTRASSGDSRSSSFTVALPTAGITYSLNIANASDLRNDVLARPSLIALDRQPSVFFSGNSLTVSVSGSLTDGDLEDKLVGVSLAVTPTFLDGDRVLLSVRAARSDIEDNTVGTFTEALNTTLNSVSANVMMRMDQTLVLSGLTEKTKESVRDRTPLLGEIPGIQYLFSSSQQQEIQRSILVVLTPRRPVSDAAASEGEATDPDAAEMRELLRKDLALPPATLSTMRRLSSNRYVAQYKSGDLSVDSWKSRDALTRLLDDASGLLYF